MYSYKRDQGLKNILNHCIQASNMYETYEQSGNKIEALEK